MKVRLRVDSWWSAPTTLHMAAKTWSWSLMVAWRTCSTQRFDPKFHGVCGGEPGPTGLQRSTQEYESSWVTQPPDSCSELGLCAFSHLFLQSRAGHARTCLHTSALGRVAQRLICLNQRGSSRKVIQPKKACLSSFLSTAAFVRHMWLANV